MTDSPSPSVAIPQQKHQLSLAQIPRSLVAPHFQTDCYMRFWNGESFSVNSRYDQACPRLEGSFGEMLLDMPMKIQWIVSNAVAHDQQVHQLLQSKITINITKLELHQQITLQTLHFQANDPPVWAFIWKPAYKANPRVPTEMQNHTFEGIINLELIDDPVLIPQGENVVPIRGR